MDFYGTREVAKFCADVRAWLAANAAKELHGPVERPGFGRVSLEGNTEC